MRSDIQPLFGMEFEVSFSAFDEQSCRMSSERILHKLMSVAGARYAHLPAHNSSGIFLGNGGRLYLDCGKPEITTPEVMTPTDACRYARAGEEMLLDISRELLSEMKQVKQIVMTRGNVSYSGSSNAWACHESYGHRHFANMADDFIPHAVSRIIYTGAGGFDNRSQGIRFMISPRVTHIRSAVSENTQRDRGIFNTKDESLSRGDYRRLHVICGENESSIRSQWLKIASTAVVIAMTEAGMSPGEGLRLRYPVKAMRTFAQDVTLSATAITYEGKHLTALDTQRHLLEKAKRLEVTGPLNDWLPHCCQMWEETLDRLQQGATAVQRTIDWAIKLELFQNYVQRRGLSWERLEQWNSVLEKLDAGLMTEELLSDGAGRVLENSQRAEQLRRRRYQLDPRSRLNWSELDLVLTVRQELFEIDTRFGELGERGIFNCLDAQGFLDHHVEGVDHIQQAMTEPPADGRAHLRGKAIQALAEQQKPGACEWTGVWDFRDARMLDLSDPFACEETWVALSETVGSEEYRQLRVARSFDQAVRLYDRGEYESASRLLRAVAEWMSMLGRDAPQECCRFTAWIQSHRGYADGASWLEVAHRAGPQTLSEICDFLLVYRFQGLRPGPQFRHWCDQGLQWLSRRREAEPRDIVSLRCCHAYDLLCQGRPTESWNAYHDDIQPQWMQAVHRRCYARILTEKADVLRHLGRLDEAKTLLTTARQIQVDGDYLGDVADLTLPLQAKIAVQNNLNSSAWDMLERALQMQRDAANVVGEARSLLLMARIAIHVNAPEADRRLQQMHERVTQICESRPALSACQLTNSILNQWDRWIASEPSEGKFDLFEGL